MASASDFAVNYESPNSLAMSPLDYMNAFMLQDVMCSGILRYKNIAIFSTSDVTGSTALSELLNGDICNIAL